MLRVEYESSRRTFKTPSPDTRARRDNVVESYESSCKALPQTSLAPHGVSVLGRGAAQRAACLELFGGRGLACLRVLSSRTSLAMSNARLSRLLTAKLRRRSSR